MAHYVILGTGIAGFSAAAEIRRHEKTADITMVGAEKELTYLRPLLSKTDLRTFRPTAVLTADEAWYKEQNIRVLCGTAVTAIHRKAHTVTLADGRSLPYDKCIYALGASCFVPPIPGAEKPGVLTLRSLGDFHRLRRLSMGAKNAVLIGGGIIGMEMAAELTKIGIRCTVLEAAPRLMPRQLDAESSEVLQNAMAAMGIPCHTGVQVAAITGEDAAAGVRLADGRQFPADIVILSTGIRAVTAPAAAAGLRWDRGIVTDDTLLTSDPDILAAGDCLQCGSPNPGLWKYAQASGEIAGYNAVFPHAPKVFRAGAFPVILTLPGMGLYAGGDTQEGEGITTEVTRKTGEAAKFLVNPLSNTETYQKCFYRDGKLLGAVLLGDIRGMAEMIKYFEEAQR